MTLLQSYHVRKQAIVPLLLGYVIFAIVATPKGEIEVFPFFRWSLFSVAYANSHDATIYITSLNGEKLEKPTNFYDLPDKFEAARGRSPAFFKAVDRLAIAHLNQMDDDVQKLSSQLERNYFNKYRDVEYELSIIHFDPVERFHTGEVRDRKILQRFRKSS